MSYIKFTEWCNHHHNPVLEYLHHSALHPHSVVSYDGSFSYWFDLSITGVYSTTLALAHSF